MEYENGTLEVRKCEGKIAGGTVRGAASLDIAKKYVRGGSLAVAGMDLKKTYDTYPRRRGEISGRADITATLTPGPMDADSIACSGSFRLSNVSLEKIPLLNNIVVILAVPLLSSVYFEKSTGEFSLDRGVVTCRNVSASGRPIDLEAGGQIGRGGSIELDVGARFGPEYKDSLGSLAWNSLLPEADGGGRRFECILSGTFDNPRIHISERITRRAVRNVFENIRREFRSAFQ
jgi:hypothetical protein